jgi:hypothetical protein
MIVALMATDALMAYYMLYQGTTPNPKPDLHRGWALHVCTHTHTPSRQCIVCIYPPIWFLTSLYTHTHSR